MDFLTYLMPWTAVKLYNSICMNLSLKADPPASVPITTIAHHTHDYEQHIMTLWKQVKFDPTKANIIEFIDHLVTASDEVWEELFKDLLNVEELLSHHQKLLEDEVESHKYYLQQSLLPDLLKEVGKGSDAFNKFDHRVVIMYSGALWATGNLAFIMFDGSDFRDTGDMFLFSGPNDSETCTGDRGCDQYAGKTFTVAEILVDDIIPGHLRCHTNCRHVLIPVASPLSAIKDSSYKGGAGSGNWAHLGRPGKTGGSRKGGGLARLGLTSGSMPIERQLRAMDVSRTREDIKGDLTFAANHLGINPDKLKYAGEGYEFEVNGIVGFAAMDYSPNDDVIRVFDGGLSDEGFVKLDLLSHEVQHYKFNEVTERSYDLAAEIAPRLNEESIAGIKVGSPESFLKSNNRYNRPEDTERYKLLTRRTGLFTKYTLKKMKSLPPVSNYSDRYMKEVNPFGNGTSYTFKLAINESLAEVARLRSSGGQINPYWDNLYDEELENYEAATKHSG